MMCRLIGQEIANVGQVQDIDINTYLNYNKYLCNLLDLYVNGKHANQALSLLNRLLKVVLKANKTGIVGETQH
jgi:hypothetical protein